MDKTAYKINKFQTNVNFIWMERNSIDKRKQIERNENIYVKEMAFDNSWAWKESRCYALKTYVRFAIESKRVREKDEIQWNSHSNGNRLSLKCIWIDDPLVSCIERHFLYIHKTKKSAQIDFWHESIWMCHCSFLIKSFNICVCVNVVASKQLPVVCRCIFVLFRI